MTQHEKDLRNFQFLRYATLAFAILLLAVVLFVHNESFGARVNLSVASVIDFGSFWFTGWLPGFMKRYRRDKE